MLLSGYTFIRNGISLGYPFVECILSALPLCEEFVIGIANDSDDDTAKWCEKIQAAYPDRVRLFPFDWPAVTQTGTSIGAAQTLLLRQCKGWYAWCIQADEAYHPNSLPVIHTAVKQARYEAFTVPFQHIQNNFQSVIDMHTAAYTRAVRIVRTIPRIQAHHDGWSFEQYLSSSDLMFDTPVSHVGYEFCDAICRKWASHAKLYYDLEEYQVLAAEWQAKAASGNFGPEFDKTTSPFDLPPILNGLVGMRDYVVRDGLIEHPEHFGGVAIK